MKTLEEAQTEFYDDLIEGTTCPCCDRWAKVYKRSINSSMAKGLIASIKTMAWITGIYRTLAAREGLQTIEKSLSCAGGV
jgi:hypothetical protein